MIIDFNELTASEVYFAMTQTLVPRPIAWVLSESAGGGLNLAPFSYFTGVCSDPPLICLSVGKKRDKSPKDTRANIEARREFVVHIPHVDQMALVNESALPLPAEASEVERLGLETVPLGSFRLPRLADCRAAMACSCHEIFLVGAADQALILGEVKALYLDDGVATRDERDRLKIPVDRLDPLARLGATEYARLGEVMTLGPAKER